MFVASLVFTLGTVLSALAPDFAGFLAGRAITGTGGAGIVACSIILVLDLAPENRRGIFLGLVNTGFTVGVSLGAVVAGALVSSIGWVSSDLWASAFADNAVASHISRSGSIFGACGLCTPLRDQEGYGDTHYECLAAAKASRLSRCCNFGM